MSGLQCSVVLARPQLGLGPAGGGPPYNLGPLYSNLGVPLDILLSGPHISIDLGPVGGGPPYNLGPLYSNLGVPLDILL